MWSLSYRQKWKLFLVLFYDTALFIFQYNDLSFIEIEEDGSLRILGVQDMDAGQYTCMASNAAGSTRAQVTLTVGCKHML